MSAPHLRITEDAGGLELEVRVDVRPPRTRPVELYLGPGWRSFTPDQADELARALAAAAAEAREHARAAAPPPPAADNRCAQCGRELAPWTGTPEPPQAMRDEHGVPMQWCSGECSEAWMAADPKRREGWVAVGDLTPERLDSLLRDVGLTIGTGKEPDLS